MCQNDIQKIILHKISTNNICSVFRTLQNVFYPSFHFGPCLALKGPQNGPRISNFGTLDRSIQQDLFPRKKK